MITIWHNPRCSKSRQTLALLEETGQNISVRHYLEDAPSTEEIKQVLTLLNAAPIDLIRRQEPEFREAQLSKLSGDVTLIATMATIPKLIERPIVFANGKAALGRPPESVLNILA